MSSPSAPARRTSALPAPVRARTALRLASPAAWTLGHRTDQVVAPFVDCAGTPLLMVSREQADALLEPGRVTAVITPAGAVGTVMISGWPREAGPDEFAAEVAAYRVDHVDCGPGCRPDGPVVVAVEVSHVRITGGDDHVFRPVALTDYRRATPDAFLLQSSAVVDHLNSAHNAELITIAAALRATADESILGAWIREVDPDGLVLTVIDVAGADDVELRFDRHLSSIDDLGSHLHRLLADPLGYLRR
jgi:hypothetical protein